MDLPPRNEHCFPPTGRRHAGGRTISILGLSGVDIYPRRYRVRESGNDLVLPQEDLPASRRFETLSNLNRTMEQREEKISRSLFSVFLSLLSSPSLTLHQDAEQTDDVAVLAAGHDLHLSDEVLLQLDVRRLLEQLDRHVHRLVVHRQVHACRPGGGRLVKRRATEVSVVGYGWCFTGSSDWWKYLLKFYYPAGMSNGTFYLSHEHFVVKNHQYLQQEKFLYKHHRNPVRGNWRHFHFKKLQARRHSLWNHFPLSMPLGPEKYLYKLPR